MTLLEFMAVFEEFRAPSWDGWRTVLSRITEKTRELWAICGRGSGKSRIVAFLAVCWAAGRQYALAPGEYVYVGIFAPDRKQAAVTFRYVRGLLTSVPALAALIVNETKDSLELSNGVVIEVITASLAAPRGRAYALAIVEEAAFLPTDQSANPDTELLRALRPALARVPGSLLAVVSSPYARRGEVWRAWQRYHGQPDGEVVFVQAETLALNPTFDQHAIERAYEEDPASAAAEYGAQFRTDVETFVAREAVEACVVPERRELPPAGHRYTAFVDPSGGSQDSMTLAIAHREEGRVVLDLLRERRPPFSPEAVVREFVETLRAYGVTRVTGDRYGGEWPRERFREHGITYDLAAQSKSDLYRAVLPMINSGRVELLDEPRLIAQLCALERRTARGGRDSIDHAPGGRDDVANAVSGALVLAASGRRDPHDWGISIGPPSPTRAELERAGIEPLCGICGCRHRDPCPAADLVARPGRDRWAGWRRMPVTRGGVPIEHEEETQ